MGDKFSYHKLVSDWIKELDFYGREIKIIGQRTGDYKHKELELNHELKRKIAVESARIVLLKKFIRKIEKRHISTFITPDLSERVSDMDYIQFQIRTVFYGMRHIRNLAGSLKRDGSR